METEVIIIEEEGAQGGGGDAPVAEDTAGAAEPTAEETAPAADAAAGEGDGGRTADPEVAGASDAAPATGPSAGEEQRFYLEAPNGVFIQMPWGSSSRAPAEGEAFDGEVLASAGLKIVQAPGGGEGPEEERLLHQLLALYRARQAKLASLEALAAKATAEMEKRAAELSAANQAALREVAEERERLAGEYQEWVLEKAEAEEQQRLAGVELSRRE